jgi:hypothetical protein
MLNWLIKRFSPALWRIQMEARVETCEAHIMDVRERFTRMQSRDSMRLAREAKTGPADLLAEAERILGAVDASSVHQDGANGPKTHVAKQHLYQKMAKRVQ